MKDGFENSLDHLLAELKRIELKLYLQVMISRQESASTRDLKFQGLYVSDKEIDNILATHLEGEAGSAGQDNPNLLSLTESLNQLEADISQEKQASLGRGLVLRLHELQKLFHLSQFDIDTLLTCLLPEIGLQYQRLYAYLQDDVTKKSPTVDLILRLFCESLEDSLTARQAFSPQAPLIRNHLLGWDNGYASTPAPLPARLLRVDERITSYLLGAEHIDERILSFAHLRQPKVNLTDVILPDEAKHRLSKLVEGFKESDLILCFKGGYGVGKQTTAEATCHQLGVPLLIIDMEHMLAADLSPELSLSLIFREALLQKAALYLDNYDTLLSEEPRANSFRDHLMKKLDACPEWVFLSGERDWPTGDSLTSTPFISIEFPVPTYTERQQLWSKFWNGQPAGSIDFNELADKFRLSGGQIRDAVSTARSLALWRSPDSGLVTIKDLYTACRHQSGQRLNTLAHKIHPNYDWEDIVLPKDQIEQLFEICCYVKHYHTVYDSWGFGRKLSLGKGLNVLFAGPSGTGKTMAAEIMARELGLDLYKIDLSAIVSKYIGETEKNLNRIFREGQSSNAILFFDEADALFGKRSEVRDSHDRYANIEIAYLLQKMEEYDGVVILATNLRKNMDEAFARRMHFALEFPIPEEEDRYRIWQRIFPVEASLAEDIDLSFLSRQFKISGGNIKNIALSAAFLAAEDGGFITMEKLIRATKREYQKMGKLCTEGDFAQYFDLVKG